MTPYLTYAIGFLIYLLIQALFINGVFISAKGKDTVLPDGTIEKGEMILYPIYRFLNQFTVEKVFYTLPVIQSKVGSNFPQITGGRIVWDAASTQFKVILTPGQNLNIDALKTWAANLLEGNVFYDAGESTIGIYQNITFYKFSKYIRKPIISCVVCMASFWSIFLFLMPALFLFGVNYKIFLIWVVNVFCLAYLNYVIFKPLK